MTSRLSRRQRRDVTVPSSAPSASAWHRPYSCWATHQRCGSGCTVTSAAPTRWWGGKTIVLGGIGGSDPTPGLVARLTAPTPVSRAAEELMAKYVRSWHADDGEDE